MSHLAVFIYMSSLACHARSAYLRPISMFFTPHKKVGNFFICCGNFHTWNDAPEARDAPKRRDTGGEGWMGGPLWVSSVPSERLESTRTLVGVQRAI